MNDWVEIEREKKMKIKNDMATWGHDSCIRISVVMPTIPLPTLTLTKAETSQSILASHKKTDYHSDSPVAFEKR